MRGQRARALRRSQESTRLTRKLASVERHEHERELDRQLSKLRNERADAMKAANAAFEKKVKAADQERKKAVQAADADYVEKRDATIKRLARDATEVAA